MKRGNSAELPLPVLALHHGSSRISSGNSLLSAAAQDDFLTMPLAYRISPKYPELFVNKICIALSVTYNQNRKSAT
jgi:hypothetical protein